MLYPPDAPVPDSLCTETLLLRPLKTTDVELDYDAVVSSRAELFLRSGGDWPREGFTLAENLADLARHEQEHLDRVAFTYTVMNPTETECLGCVYIKPLENLKSAGLPAESVSEYSAYASFWVRSSRLDDHLDKALLQALLTWFPTEWAFSQVAFLTTKAQTRQIQLFEETGLQLLHTLKSSLLYLPPIQ